MLCAQKLETAWTKWNIKHCPADLNAESVTNLLDVPVKEEDTATDPNIWLQENDLEYYYKK